MEFIFHLNLEFYVYCFAPKVLKRYHLLAQIWLFGVFSGEQGGITDHRRLGQRASCPLPIERARPFYRLLLRYRPAFTNAARAATDGTSVVPVAPLISLPNFPQKTWKSHKYKVIFQCKKILNELSLPTLATYKYRFFRGACFFAP